MSSQKFQNTDRREQEQLEIIRGRIEDATKGTILWLQHDPSAEERVHVLAIQTGLANLARIIERRMEDRKEAKDHWLWSETVDEVKSRLEKAREARGTIVGKDLARFAERIPRELPGPQPRLVSKAPPPITPVGGLGLAPSRPKPTQVPNLPPYYPNDLIPRTQFILAEAVRKFPDQTKTLELCKYIISKLTPLFGAAVRSGTLRADLALSQSGGMEALLHSVLIYNDTGPRSGFGGLSNEAYRLEQEAKRSNEWLRLARAIDRAQNSAKSAHSVESKSTNAAAGPSPTDHQAMVRAYIEEVRSKTGQRITKKDIWSKAGYQTRTEFERWERQDLKHPNKSADENFTRTLREKPHLK